MKQRFGKMIYDTEKADKLHEWENTWNRKDGCYTYEALYRTKKENYFLVQEAYKYKHYEGPGQGMALGKEIIPVSEDKAVKWLDEHGGDEVVLKEFTLEEA